MTELVAYAKSKAGVAYASPGNGSPQHLTMELFKSQMKLDMTHVPYRGDAPMLTDLISGQVPMAFASLPSCIAHVKAGKLRALGVSSARRSPALPEVPSISEQVPGCVGDLWVGLFAVAGVTKLPVETVTRATLPYLLPLLLALALITYMPALTLWLPDLVMGPALARR